MMKLNSNWHGGAKALSVLQTTIYSAVIGNVKNSSLYLTVVTQQCGAMFLLYNYQPSDMFRPYRAIIRLIK